MRARVTNIRTKLGQRINELRRARQYTQTELAMRAGISLSFISMIERGERIPHVETLVMLASALGVSLSEMFRGVG